MHNRQKLEGTWHLKYGNSIGWGSHLKSFLLRALFSLCIAGGGAQGESHSLTIRAARATGNWGRIYWKVMTIKTAYKLPSTPGLPPELCIYRMRFQECRRKMTVAHCKSSAEISALWREAALGVENCWGLEGLGKPLGLAIKIPERPHATVKTTF